MRRRRSPPSRGQFVRLQQALARKAFDRGDLDAARVILRALRPADFDGARVISDICLRVLRDDTASETSVRAAVHILGRLPVQDHEVATS
jgi:hypothetical protein